ncbi:hypothetical protein BBK82_13840 [Lentzea guizhouensis]|uniref:DUF3592 domain-containing protein n=1 Tax=Lentzea guizhouensis TaxID=1586287 RepID=A0A1B2HGZ9_9PSEU|nr:hypothetical protein [Lentzea guizhouensis]ANZ36992.1 hypothetical protein BBK82_13840 [Lentzea guizhouensis]
MDGFLPGGDPVRTGKSDLPRAFAVLAVLAGIALLVLFGLTVRKAAKVAFDPVVPGTYLVQGEPRCGSKPSSTCTSESGEFVGDDGVVRSGVYLEGVPKPLRKGDRVRAFDFGDPVEVYRYETNTRVPFVLSVACAVLGTAGVGLGVSWLWQRGRARRAR